MALKTVGSGGGGWLKADEHADDAAILFECKRFERQRPTDYGPRDSMVCDVTFFKTVAEVNAGTPSQVAKGMRVEYTALTRELADEVGEGNATIATLGKAAKKKPGQQPAWVFRKPSDEVVAKVAEYYEQREARIAEAMESVPDFD